MRRRAARYIVLLPLFFVTLFLGFCNRAICEVLPCGVTLQDSVSLTPTKFIVYRPGRKNQDFRWRDSEFLVDTAYSSTLTTQVQTTIEKWSCPVSVDG